MLNDELSLHDAAINLLATGYSVSEVAEIFNIDSSTVRRWWRADPLFKLTVEAIQEQITLQQLPPKRKIKAKGFASKERPLP
jgi:transposase-like protein